jgi:hypothetical protein
MTHPVSEEWTTLADAWQSAPVAHGLSLEILLRRERRRRILMVLLVVSEVLISLAGLAFAYLVARRLPASGGSILVGGVVVYIGVITAFVVWNRRGTWRPLAETMEAFIAISMLRCRRGLRTVRFVTGIVLAQLAAMLAWALVERSGNAWFGVILSAGIGAGYLGWAVWYRWFLLRQLAFFQSLAASADR